MWRLLLWLCRGLYSRRRIQNGGRRSRLVLVLVLYLGPFRSRKTRGFGMGRTSIVRAGTSASMLTSRR